MIMVTGGHGFVGTHLMPLLKGQKMAVRSKGFDLRDPARVDLLFRETKPKEVIHLAANVGGIGYNRDFPGELFYDNLMMGLNILEASRKHKVKKLVMVGTVCSYPKHATVPFREEDLWLGYPEETNAPYGIAKKALLVGAQAYRKQYGLNTTFLIPVNMYGPNDNFGAGSHVIPALIDKIEQARINKEKTVDVWGTGRATREFLYVEDCAHAIKLALEQYNGEEPINLGVGEEISILELSNKIKGLCGYTGDLVFDNTNPDGQPRRKLDTTKALQFGFKATTSLDEGLRKTIAFYRDAHLHAQSRLGRNGRVGH